MTKPYGYVRADGEGIFIYGEDKFQKIKDVVEFIPIYTEPPQRTWVDLTDDEMLMIYGQNHEGKKYNLGRMVQQALKEKNA